MAPLTAGLQPTNAAVATGTAAPASGMDWLGTLLGGAAGAYGAQNAAEGQQQADQTAINYQQGIQNTITGQYGQQSATGNAALKSLTGVLGLGGNAPDESVFTNMPGYNFQVNQGTQAINRAAAANGSLYTPQTLASIGQYVTGTAATDYNTYVNQLLQTAGFGNSANAGIAQGDLSTGANIAQLTQNKGQAGASGVSGSSSAIGGALSGLFGANGALNGVGSSIIGSIGSGISGLFGSGANSSGVAPNTGDANGLNPNNNVPTYNSPIYNDQENYNQSGDTTYFGGDDSTGF